MGWGTSRTSSKLLPHSLSSVFRARILISYHSVIENYLGLARGHSASTANRFIEKIYYTFVHTFDLGRRHRPGPRHLPQQCLIIIFITTRNFESNFFFQGYYQQ